MKIKSKVKYPEAEFMAEKHARIYPKSMFDLWSDELDGHIRFKELIIEEKILSIKLVLKYWFSPRRIIFGTLCWKIGCYLCEIGEFFKTLWFKHWWNGPQK